MTPYDGQLVEVEGVVTAIVESQNGFYLQDFGDGDITTSDGIFVFTGSASFDLAEGDEIRLSGYAGEYYDNSQLSSINELVHCGSSSLPTPYDVVLPVDDALALEALEGMRVQLSDLTVNEVYNLGRYGEVLLANGRRWIPTQIATPGDESQAIDAQNELNKLLLDDGSTAQNPANVPFPTGGLSADNTLRVGDTVDSAVGVMYYSYSEYRVYPTSDVEFSATNPRTLAPEILTEGNLKVASFNVLNFFNGDGEGDGFPTARGAESAEELSRQSAKLIEAMVTLDADIIGVMEIENDGYGELSAIAELTNLLATASGQNWAFIDAGGPIGTDEIAVGLLYRPDVVSPVAEPQILTSENSPIDDDGVALFNDQKNRPALAQQFQLDNEASLVAIVNHLKSKGSACGDGDDDSTTGQGNCNLTRTRAAQALAQWTEQQFAEQAVLIMGDLNAYAKEDPITTLEQAGFQQASEVLGKENSYSYVYSGETGQLDHALVNESLASTLIDVTEWHINTDEPKALDYTLSYKSIEQQDLFYAADAYRSSDHDPVVVAFDIAAPDATPTARFQLVRLGRIFIAISRAYDEEDGLRGLQHQWQVNGADAGSYRWVMGRINRRDALEVTLTVTDSAEQSDSLTKLSQR
ncbi:ExeM/NucH family extracellular endonuclease [Neiella marina]|uniref:ExeM/NucH family extracellular endonuclease n=1 Tax=Neiella holothuriorum TaxID=2870530 RepID=A0ABS7EHE0_9GAMM|nr:ExeM/NucH family extracellular endonuclease [Neiella holothuriorum]MBW8191740.1 ExeM/NucH family extracellular endonuclease [Neiella holothuriorum]